MGKHTYATVFEQLTFNPKVYFCWPIIENVILAYDTADDSDDATLDYSDSEQRDASDDFSKVEDYSDVQIDWSAWISSMPDPVLLD